MRKSYFWAWAAWGIVGSVAMVCAAAWTEDFPGSRITRWDLAVVGDPARVVRILVQDKNTQQPIPKGTKLSLIRVDGDGDPIADPIPAGRGTSMTYACIDWYIKIQVDDFLSPNQLWIPSYAPHSMLVYFDRQSGEIAFAGPAANDTFNKRAPAAVSLGRFPTQWPLRPRASFSRRACPPVMETHVPSATQSGTAIAW